jgi:hypothetical protein
MLQCNHFYYVTDRVIASSHTGSSFGGSSSASGMRHLCCITVQAGKWVKAFNQRVPCNEQRTLQCVVSTVCWVEGTALLGLALGCEFCTKNTDVV